jgi:predicted N-acyltransferase
MPISNSFDFQIVHSVTEIDPESWDRLSAGRPFTSHQWYRYGEAVLADCEPTYLVVHQQGQPVARATFWKIKNDPIFIQPAFIKHSIQAFLKRWPMLTCRSPLSSLSGLILPDSPLREVIQAAIGAKANELLHQKGCSVLIFDYLSKEQCVGWPENFSSTSFSNPGTILNMTWQNFETYLEAGNKKDRQHYKKTVREAEKLGIQVSRHSSVNCVEEALTLIRNVEHRFGSPEDPWACTMLEHIEMVGGTFLTATIGTELVGCGLILEDNGAQMNTTLGLANNVPYVYFVLIYESLKVAFDHHIHLLRMGSGAYEVKEQLGFSKEYNNNMLFSSQNRLLRTIARLVA